MAWTTVVSHCSVGFRSPLRRGVGIFTVAATGGVISFLAKARQGGKISVHKILNFTPPPPLLNYDQSLKSRLTTFKNNDYLIISTYFHSDIDYYNDKPTNMFGDDETCDNSKV